MSEHLFLLTLCLVLGTILLVFGMRSFAAIQQAKARLANDQAYRPIAERAVAAQSASGAALSSIQATLTDVRTRLCAVEKILKEVEEGAGAQVRPDALVRRSRRPIAIRYGTVALR